MRNVQNTKGVTMEDDGEGLNRARPQDGNSVVAMGPIYLLWENSLEKLKLLNYEVDYCKKLNKRPFSRVHFILPSNNASHQFDDFVGICAWMCLEISKRKDLFKPEEFDDPNTIVNKLMLALRQLEFKSSFPVQKLKLAHGESVCQVLDYLTDKLLSTKKIHWSEPSYSTTDNVQQEEIDDSAAGGIEEDLVEVVEDEFVFEDIESARLETSLDDSAHHMLQAMVDPVEWKTELERVGPKLRANQQFGTNEWRSHVDQTLTSKSHIEKVVTDAQSDLQLMFKTVADELNKMRMKEKYLSNQYNSLGLEYIEVKHKLEELDLKSSSAHETVAKLTSDLAELTERLDELKESFDSKDSGLHDTSPLVKIKAALQQVKAEIHSFDMRIGVVSHSLLSARINDTNRLRTMAVSKSRQRHKKKQVSDDNSLLSDD